MSMMSRAATDFIAGPRIGSLEALYLLQSHTGSPLICHGGAAAVVCYTLAHAVLTGIDVAVLDCTPGQVVPSIRARAGLFSLV